MINLHTTAATNGRKGKEPGARTRRTDTAATSGTTRGLGQRHIGSGAAALPCTFLKYASTRLSTDGLTIRGTVSSASTGTGDGPVQSSHGLTFAIATGEVSRPVTLYLTRTIRKQSEYLWSRPDPECHAASAGRARINARAETHSSGDGHHGQVDTLFSTSRASAATARAWVRYGRCTCSF